MFTIRNVLEPLRLHQFYTADIVQKWFCIIKAHLIVSHIYATA